MGPASRTQHDHWCELQQQNRAAVLDADLLEVYKAIAADPADVAARRQSLLDHGARRAHEPVSLLRGVPDDHPLEMGVSL